MNESVIRALTGWDYGVIAFYLVFVCSIGVICRKLSKGPSDYFRGGGNMVWWLGGMSAMATSISTWSFTGGAAKCYNDGFVYPLTMLMTAVPSLVVMLYFAPRFRRLRVITAMEAVFRRFGSGTEQFYTWFALPMGLFWGGIGLNTLAVFMSSVFHGNLVVTLIVVGVIVTLLATLGGQWAVSFGAFVQGMLLFLVVIVVAFFSVNLPEIGGVANLVNVLPERQYQFDTNISGALVWMWIGWSIVSGVLMQMDMRNSGKYVRVKDDRNARGMVLLAWGPWILLLIPLLIHLPSICASAVYPDLGKVFPQLKNPEEGAWLVMAFKVLPQGLLGLMVCALFSAAADSADAALNSNAGFFVRNVYIHYINPKASDLRQVVTGKLTTMVFGGLTIGIALMVNSLRSLNLFDLFQVLNAMLVPPMIVPMILGIFIKRTPAWSGWSTVLVGLLVSVVAKYSFDTVWVQHLLGVQRDLTPREIVDSQFLFISVITWSLSILWFLGTIPLWRSSSEAHHHRVDVLFDDLARPVDHMGEGGEDQDAMQFRITGVLCLILGGFLLLCIAIPNPLKGRLTFLFIGGVLTGLGALLWRIYRRKARLRTIDGDNTTPSRTRLSGMPRH
jgi:Na+/proline symporter